MWGAVPVRPISTKLGTVVGVDDVMIQSNFGFNIFRGFRCTLGQNFCFHIDFAGRHLKKASRDSASFLCGCIERHFAALAISHP